ncbi:MAG: sigma factor G inhibitor Gin [Clostridiaceae bacterium]
MEKVKCIMCGKPLKQNAIMIYGRGICRHCEERIIECDINTDFYDYYKEMIKKIIVSSGEIKGEELKCTDCHY